MITDEDLFHFFCFCFENIVSFNVVEVVKEFVVHSQVVKMLAEVIDRDWCHCEVELCVWEVVMTLDLLWRES